MANQNASTKGMANQIASTECMVIHDQGEGGIDIKDIPNLPDQNKIILSLPRI